MKFYIISTDLFKLPLDGTHILSNRKLAKGFEQNGYEIIEITNKNINIIENNKGNFIILSNFMDFKNDWNKMAEFGKKYDNLCYILWCWHYIPNPPFKTWVYTFQESHYEPTIEPYKSEYHLFKKLEHDQNFIPYRFASYIDPLSDFRKLNNINKEYDIVYIGCSYEMDKLNIIKTKKYKSFIHISGGGPSAITGDKFAEIYRKSKICLGFMADGNNKSNVITERIWEAFSFGCMVITNSRSAETLTNGTAIYYNDINDLLNIIDYYLKNEDKRLEKIEEGYKIFTTYGNYKRNAKEFIDYLDKKADV